MPLAIFSTDQMGGTFHFKKVPARIISLVPSQTEFLFDLGMGDEIVGVTKFCVHPKEKCREKARIGGTKKFNFEAIDQLRPDLIIGNKEENYKEGIEVLKARYPVWMSDISTLDEALEMMRKLGSLLNKSDEAQAIVHEIEEAFKNLSLPMTRRALYFIWKDPYMCVGRDTFIHEMLPKCGLENALKGQSRYPVLTADEISMLDPDVILLSSEPYPFQEKHVNEFREICPRADIAIVDGELFSWYGSRLRYSAAYFFEIGTNLKVTERP